jgi:hypothetical protein
MLSKAVDNILSPANKPWQFGQLCDVSLLPIPPSIPSTLAALIPLNNIDNDPQNVSQLRDSHYFSLNTVTSIQSIK